MTRKYVGHEEDGRKLQMSHVWELLRTCTPMFIGTFLSLLLYNIPKYAMAGVMTDEYQTYYSILFMPSFVISLMCEFVFKPTITTIAELWWENNVKKFTLYILRIIGIILVCCVAVVAGGHLIGRTLLEIIYGVDLSPYKLHFVVLLIGGGISAEVYMIYNILIAIRWGKCLLPVYSITASYYHRSCPDPGAAVGNYGRSIELCTVLLHFVCAVYFDSGLCNSSKKTSRTNSVNTTPPEGKCPLLGLFFPGDVFLFSFRIYAWKLILSYIFIAR